MMNSPEAPVDALAPKTKLTGKVVKVTLAGALIDIGQSLPGVLHISQIQSGPVQKVDDLIREGQVVDVWVRKLRKDRVELTMIEPLRYEWAELQPEMIVAGKVVRLETYGAFVDVGAERPGLIHISELAQGYVKSPRDVVKEGDDIQVKVLSVDGRKRQMRLSLKALEPEAEEPEAPKKEQKRARRPKASAPAEEVPEALEPSAPEVTSMQAAWQEAQDRAKTKGKAGPSKRVRPGTSEQEDILNRTLEKRMPTGA